MAQTETSADSGNPADRIAESGAVEDLDPSGHRAKSFFLWALTGTLVLRGLLAAFFPFTGDEVYYWQWGRNPSWGYYDQPPMVGWWLSLLSRLSNHPFVLRLPALAASPLIAWLGVRTVARLFPDDPARAWLAGTFLLLAPFSVLNVIITTDTPLLVFGSLFLFFLLRTLETRRLRDAALAGACAGLGFLSKYFIVLWVAACAPLLLVKRSAIRPLRFGLREFGTSGVFAMAIAALPSIGAHLYWNWNECWINLVFNLITRHKKSSLNPESLAQFGGHQLYLLSPLLLAGLIVLARRKLGSDVPRRARLDDAQKRAVAGCLLVFGTGITAFAISAAKFPQGLNWTLGQHFALWLGLAMFLAKPLLRSLLAPIALFSVLHALLALGISLIPVEWPGEWLSQNRRYADAVLFTHPHEVIGRVRELLPESSQLVSGSYTLSAMSEWASNGDLTSPLFLNVSKFGRLSDSIHDLALFDGKALTGFSISKPSIRKWRPYFDRVERRKFEVRGASFYLINGYGFRFEPYRSKVLRSIARKFYPLPELWPCGPCSFIDRYFPASSRMPDSKLRPSCPAVP